MERKIGEIFEYYGEWYQCIEGEWCRTCDCYRPNMDVRKCNHYPRCMALKRSDQKSVIFKKLEKIGEPFIYNYENKRLVRMQEYELFDLNFYKEPDTLMIVNDYILKRISIEIKQNKEDMEEKKLKPFSIEAAKAGKPICTRDGRKARIICFDLEGAEYPIVAAIKPHNCDTESLSAYDEKGKYNHECESSNDLMMLPDKKEGWVNVYDADTTFYFVEGMVYDTKEEAIKHINPDHEIYITTVKIEWEE